MHDLRYTHAVRRAASQLSALMVVHNQTVLLGALMGIKLPPFIFDESPLPLIFDTTFQKAITSTLHKLKYLAPGNLYRTPMSNGGKASVALAGQWSKKLGRDRFTMEERGEASVALAGEWSEKLGRDRATMEERGEAGGKASGRADSANTAVLIIFRHRHSRNLEWSPWLGSRYLYSDDRLDGISRNALAPEHVKSMAMVGPQPVPPQPASGLLQALMHTV